MPTEDDKRDKEISWRQALASVGLALSLPMMIAIPVLAGWYLDRHFGTWPVLFIVSVVFGLLGVAVDIYKLLKQFGQFK